MINCYQSSEASYDYALFSEIDTEISYYYDYIGPDDALPEGIYTTLKDFSYEEYNQGMPLDTTIEYTIPEGTQSGEIFRVRGKGIKTSRGVGNLYLHVVVEVPKLSREQKKQFEKLFDDVSLKQQEQMKKYSDNMEALYGENPY